MKNKTIIIMLVIVAALVIGCNGRSNPSAGSRYYAVNCEKAIKKLDRYLRRFTEKSDSKPDPTILEVKREIVKYACQCQNILK